MPWWWLDKPQNTTNLSEFVVKFLLKKKHLLAKKWKENFSMSKIPKPAPAMIRYSVAGATFMPATSDSNYFLPQIKFPPNVVKLWIQTAVTATAGKGRWKKNAL